MAFGSVSYPCLGANYSQAVFSSQLKNTLCFIKVLNMCLINVRMVFIAFELKNCLNHLAQSCLEQLLL